MVVCSNQNICITHNKHGDMSSTRDLYQAMTKSSAPMQDHNSLKYIVTDHHWSIQYKINKLKLTPRTSSNIGYSPQYLASHIHYHQSVRSLRSSDEHFLVPTPSSTNFGSCSIRSSAPVIWNSIPLAIRTTPTIDTFKRSLKTHYFCFPPV